MAGVELATAYVSLVVEGSKVAPGVKKSLGAAEGEASRAGDKAGRSFTSKFGGALKLGASLAAGFAAVKGVQFLGDAIEEAQEAAVVTARTSNVIESMGKVAGITANEVAELAGAISNKVGIDDEAIQSGQNLLLTFGNLRNEVGKGNDIFSQTSQLMVDMSVAMDQDMKSSAVMLGKALNDPIKGLTALSRVGVSFTEQQKEQITALAESGETMKAQKLILGELKRQFGGAAEAMSTPAQRMQVAWGNLKEQIGTELLPMVNRVSEWAADEGVPAIAKFFREFKKGKGAGGEVREIVEDIGNAARTAAGFAADVVGAFRGMPKWAQNVLAGGAAGAFAVSKIPGLSLGGGKGGGGLLGGGVQKVFVTNPGFGTGGLGGGKGGTTPLPGGGGAKGGTGKMPTWLAGAGILAGSMAGLKYDPKELGWEKLQGDLLKVNRAFVEIAMHRTGIDNLTGAAKGLDQILAGMTLQSPRAGFRALSNLSEKTGISMADLRDVLPQTNKAIQDSGVKAQGSGKHMRQWTRDIEGAGKGIDRVDGKKPKVPWEFPGLFDGRKNTDGLGRDTDKVGKKKPTIPWYFPNLLGGIGDVGKLNTGITRIPGKKSTTITANTGQAQSALDSLERALDSVTGSFYQTIFTTNKKREKGGPVSAGETYIVGERGPELFMSNTAGRIIPNHRLPSQKAASSGGTAVGLSDRDVARIAAAVRDGALVGTRAGMDDQRARITAARRT